MVCRSPTGEIQKQRQFPGGPVAMDSCVSTARGLEFDPWSGNYDPASCAAWQKQDKNLGLGTGSGNAKWRMSIQYSREKTDRTGDESLFYQLEFLLAATVQTRRKGFTEVHLLPFLPAISKSHALQQQSWYPKGHSRLQL